MVSGIFGFKCLKLIEMPQNSALGQAPDLSLIVHASHMLNRNLKEKRTWNTEYLSVTSPWQGLCYCLLLPF